MNDSDKRRWFRVTPKGLVPRVGRILLGGNTTPIDCRVVARVPDWNFLRGQHPALIREWRPEPAEERIKPPVTQSLTRPAALCLAIASLLRYAREQLERRHGTNHLPPWAAMVSGRCVT